MRVDFYQLGIERPERAIPLLASKVLQTGERLLIVAADETQLRSISEALWTESREGFLANGLAGAGHEARQPILLSQNVDAVNGARFVMFADGIWRDAENDFARCFLLFGDAGIEQARACWRMLGEREETERRFWKLEAGRWREGP